MNEQIGLEDTLKINHYLLIVGLFMHYIDIFKLPYISNTTNKYDL